MPGPSSAVSEAGASPWRRPRLVLLIAAVVAVITAGIGVWIAPQLQSPTQLAAQAAPPVPSLITAEVERRVLSEPVVLRGVVKPGASTKVFPGATAVGDTSVITDVLVRSGERLTEGDLVAVRAGAPMVALALPFPLYRDLTGGVHGPDVRVVQRALSRAGYAVAPTGVFDSQTQRAVRRLYSRHGFQPPTASEPSVQEPGDGVGEADASDPARPEPARERLVAGAALPRASVVVMDRAGRRISAVHIKVGSILTDPRSPVLELDGAESYLSAIAGREQAALLRVGQAATAYDDTAGVKAAATVTRIGATPLTTPDGQTGYEIRLRLAATGGKASGGRSFRVDILASSTSDKVLAAPVTAIYSAPDGHTFITIVNARGRPKDIPVTTGRTAGGWTEFAPAHSEAVPAGTRVVVGETSMIEPTK